LNADSDEDDVNPGASTSVRNTKRGAKGSLVLDIAPDKKSIPPWSCHIGSNWYVRIQFYNNNHYLVIRVFDENDKPGKGASLPLSMLPFVKKALSLAEEHLKNE